MGLLSRSLSGPAYELVTYLVTVLHPLSLQGLNKDYSVNSRLKGGLRDSPLSLKENKPYLNPKPYTPLNIPVHPHIPPISPPTTVHPNRHVPTDMSPYTSPCTSYIPLYIPIYFLCPLDICKYPWINLYSFATPLYPFTQGSFYTSRCRPRRVERRRCTEISKV